MELITRKEAKEKGLKRYFTGEACKWGHVVERFVSSAYCRACSIEVSGRYYRRNSEKVGAYHKKYNSDNKLNKATYFKKYYLENKAVFSAKRKEYIENNKEKVAEGMRKYYQKTKFRDKEKRSSQRKKYYEQNKEVVSTNGKKYREANREKIKVRMKKYSEENSDMAHARGKKWRDNNVERCIAKRKKYSRENRSKLAALTANYRAKKMRLTPPLSYVEKKSIAALFKTAKDLGQLTGRKFHVDHIWPLSKGGVHHPCNMQVLEERANLSKNDSHDGESGVSYEDFILAVSAYA